MCTLGLITLVFAFSVGISNISDVILVVGATANTIIGFCLPMIFYLKLIEIEKGPLWKRIIAHSVNIGFICLSVSSLYVFV